MTSGLVKKRPRPGDGIGEIDNTPSLDRQDVDVSANGDGNDDAASTNQAVNGNKVPKKTKQDPIAKGLLDKSSGNDKTVEKRYLQWNCPSSEGHDRVYQRGVPA